MKVDCNPLYDSQREKAGAETFEKYQYQYHWALYRVLSDHDMSKEYAVFVELHEDVVIADSLNPEKATFEFNQVKTDSLTFTTHKLVLQKKNGKSVLGKLISSGLGKPFNSKISFYNLIALNDFKLELKEPGVKLEKISLRDLSENQLELLEKEIKKELEIDSIPLNIQFIVPSLSSKNFQNDVIATIAKLIVNLFPGSVCNPVEIYRVLIDELYRKGVVTYDFANWNDLINKKSLTSIQVTCVLNAFTNLKDEAKVESEFYSICAEIGLTTIESRLIKRSFDRYRMLRIQNNSTNQLDKTKTITCVIEKVLREGVTSFLELIEKVIVLLPQKIQKLFSTQNDLKGAIICEYIMMQ